MLLFKKQFDLLNFKYILFCRFFMKKNIPYDNNNIYLKSNIQCT